MEKCCELYDVVRIDHFRGFDEYYSIPFGDKTAKNGHWEEGPGIDLFKAIKEKLGKPHIIAEDLGFITPSVRALVKKTGFPNMKVLEFAFDSRDSTGAAEYLPYRYQRNCAVHMAFYIAILVLPIVYGAVMRDFGASDAAAHRYANILTAFNMAYSAYLVPDCIVSVIAVRVLRERIEAYGRGEGGYPDERFLGDGKVIFEHPLRPWLLVLTRMLRKGK